MSSFEKERATLTAQLAHWISHAESLAIKAGEGAKREAALRREALRARVEASLLQSLARSLEGSLAEALAEARVAAAGRERLMEELGEAHRALLRAMPEAGASSSGRGGGGGRGRHGNDTGASRGQTAQSPQQPVLHRASPSRQRVLQGSPLQSASPGQGSRSAHQTPHRTVPLPDTAPTTRCCGSPHPMPPPPQMPPPPPRGASLWAPQRTTPQRSTPPSPRGDNGGSTTAAAPAVPHFFSSARRGGGHGGGRGIEGDAASSARGSPPSAVRRRLYAQANRGAEGAEISFLAMRRQGADYWSGAPRP
mmetsp:Transcript_37111/g.119813  ORF Transcript_37111/g.119813 Transcript_37111/m.119813 type:complete len:308 (-) Transcript_37111:139-1062(-)